MYTALSTVIISMAEPEKPDPKPDGGGGGGGREVSEEDAKKAEELKNKANEFFKCKDHGMMVPPVFALWLDPPCWESFQPTPPPSLPPPPPPPPPPLDFLTPPPLLPPSAAAKHYEEAIDYYSQAIELNPTVAAFYANRSFSHLKMESYGFALADADTALGLDRGYIKAGGGGGGGKGGREEERGCTLSLLYPTSAPSFHLLPLLHLPHLLHLLPPPPPHLLSGVLSPSQCQHGSGKVQASSHGL